jgi:hypothetical protein
MSGGREAWTPQRIHARAARVGPNVAIFAEVVMRDRKHPEQSYRTCLGVIGLADKFGQDRVNAACRRVLESSPCVRHRSEAHGGRQILLIAPIHSEKWAGEKAPHPRRGGACNHPQQHSWRRLFPLKGYTMLDHPTLDHLKALRLDGMAEAFADVQMRDAAADLSHVGFCEKLTQFSQTP